MTTEQTGQILGVIKRRLVPIPPSEAPLRGIAASLAVRRFREGLTNMDQFVTELQALGYPPDEVRRYQLQATLEYETDYFMDLLAAYRDAFKKDIITTEEFRAFLKGMGMVPDRVEGWVFRETIRKFPTKKG